MPVEFAKAGDLPEPQDGIERYVCHRICRDSKERVVLMKELSLVQAAREGLNEELKIDSNTCFLKIENALNKKDNQAADITDPDGQG